MERDHNILVEKGQVQEEVGSDGKESK